MRSVILKQILIFFIYFASNPLWAQEDNKYFLGEEEKLHQLGQENITGLLATLARYGIDANYEAVGETDDGTLTVAYGNLVGVLIESIKELKAEVELLKAKP